MSSPVFQVMWVCNVCRKKQEILTQSGEFNISQGVPHPPTQGPPGATGTLSNEAPERSVSSFRLILTAQFRGTVLWQTVAVEGIVPVDTQTSVRSQHLVLLGSLQWFCGSLFFSWQTSIQSTTCDVFTRGLNQISLWFLWFWGSCINLSLKVQFGSLGVLNFHSLVQ